MFRSIITLALSVFLIAEASAQTTPATTKKTTRTTRRVAKKAQRTVRKTTRAAAAAWPAPDPATPVMAAVTEPTGWEAYDDAQARQGRDAVYAAPGMNVHIRTGHEMDNYDGTPRKAPVSTRQTTLSPTPR
ncbi:hypothetical protein [Hymenobacter coccineus]|uniref:Secreted protein n=1 Tax=Hymenobacter coccineus TaxID=1908235 RepID=A0A1G1STD1_9BACT|nr:hypothetical protein [Hymenobacter coccineus]OGX81872.1 hypothetical protein BEN49_14735 [Hymenobacter coccineus]